MDIRCGIFIIADLAQYISDNLNHTEIFSPYRAVNTLRFGYKNQSVIAV